MSDVVVVGGGLAGLAAANRLAKNNYRVTLLEATQRLGGRAGSFWDPQTRQLIDHCQHVSMGCCTALAEFCKSLGVDKYLEPQSRLFFLTPDRRMSTWSIDPLPAPWHLARSFARLHFLTVAEKCRIVYGLSRLAKSHIGDDPPLRRWLHRHGQTPRLIDRFWRIILTSALNESPDRLGLKYARKVFVDAFLTDRRGTVVEVPRAPLQVLYQEIAGRLSQEGVEVCTKQRVTELIIEQDRVKAMRVADRGDLSADAYVVAVPPRQLLAILPPEQKQRYEFFAQLRGIRTSPISSLHIWYDRPITDLPHAVLLDSHAQWIFSRGMTRNGEHYYQVVVSAARWKTRRAMESRMLTELSRFFPVAQQARIVRHRMVTQHEATISCVPGIDRLRPGPVTPIDNLFLAGDWTATGWPPTMESAVRSGLAAADAVLGHISSAQREPPVDVVSQGTLGS